MRRYETIFITPESVADEAVRETAEKIQGIITRMGGKIVRTDYWGRRTMAYEIAKSRRGNYVLLVYVAGSDVVAEVERNLHINEQVVRFHTVKIEDDVDINSVQPEEPKPAPAELFGERMPRREFSDVETEESSEESLA
jgi:small subunit ribosomal protein S6